MQAIKEVKYLTEQKKEKNKPAIRGGKVDTMTEYHTVKLTCSPSKSPSKMKFDFR